MNRIAEELTRDGLLSKINLVVNKRYRLGFFFFSVVTLLNFGSFATTTDPINGATLLLNVTTPQGVVQRIVDLTIKKIVEAATGARGAAVAVAVKTDKKQLGRNTSFFGDMETIDLSVKDDWGEAAGKAKNVLRGKINEAGTGGFVAAARSVLLWNGEIVWEAPVINTLGVSVFGDLPDPGLVESASLIIDYSIVDTKVSVFSVPGAGTGSWSFDHSWGGLTSFSGSVGFDSEDPDPVFAGDLTSYAGAFSIGPGSLSVDALTINDLFSLPISYSDFFSTGEVGAEFAGRMVAQSAIPIPAALPLFGSGLGLLGLLRWRRRRATA